MKQIQLCGIGNGLVDLEITISSEQLASLGIKKGTMTLVSEKEQQELLAKLSHTEPFRCSGGSVANSIIAFTALGGKAAQKTILGNDDFGHFYEKEFLDLGIHLDAKKVDNSSTGTCAVLITEDAERTLLTSLGVNATYGKDDIVSSTIAKSEWLYIEGYKFSEPSGVESINHAIEIAKQNNTKIALSFSDTFVVNFFRNDVEKVLQNTDFLFCNETEASAYTNEDNFSKNFDLLTSKVKNVALTNGKNGSKVKWYGEIAEFEAVQVNAVDTTGAGDMYAGSLLYGLFNGLTVQQSGKLASYASAQIVAQMGARYKGNITNFLQHIV
jgi:sugar/nucleoside kinase (ribokinase family)